ncbi:MAG TPA: long-chain-fatty-acid--CoA ligase [Acidobacteriota bacterium]|jgi:long-chain acyl-CoA synthetase
MLIAQSLHRSGAGHPDKIALMYRDQRISYSLLLNTTRSYAGLFQSLGIGRGDVVAICFENSPEFVYAYYALSWLGATVLPVNLLLTPKEIAYILGDCQARAVVTRTEYWAKFAAAAAGGALKVEKGFLVGGNPEPSTIETINISERLAYQQPVSSDPEPVPQDSAAVLIYTSGTTGTPKGVMLSHHNLMSNADAVARATSALDEDTFFLLLPVFHITSQTVCLLTPILIGAAIAIVSRIDRAEMAHAFKEFLPTVFIAVPSIYNMLAAAPAPPPDKNPVRLYVSGGAPLPSEIQNRFEAAYQKPIYGGYGLTEASPVVSWNVPGANKPVSVGKPLHGVQVKITNDKMEDLPAGEIGEICVKGELVMLGYYNRPEETSQTIIDGWLRTGDMGKIDTDGYLYVVDRKKEMLIYSGINVYPREIEELLHTMPLISEAAVVGVPDAARGEIPVAFVTSKAEKPVTERQIKEFCIANLARYKVPRRFFVIDDFPRTASGKINKLQLKAEAAHRMKEVAR